MVLLAASAHAEETTFIVHLEQPETALTTLHDHKKWYSQFVGQEKVVMYAYKDVLNGFAARLTEAEVEAMREMPGFIAAYPDALLPLHTSYSAQFMGLSTTRGLWPATDFGKGVIIGMLDTGVWPESPSFDDTGMPSPPAKWKGMCESAPDFNSSNCNNKLIGARTFLSGQTEGNSSPRDEEGHGTHTSSTAAGTHVANASLFGYAAGTASGMASGAHVAMYKVCGLAGCFLSDVLAGMDQAMADGVDILSISIGGTSEPFDNDPIAVGAFTAVQKGIFVSCSAGNGGPGYSTLANEAPWIMTVGASTMDRNFIANVQLGDGRVFYGESLYPGNGLSESLPLVHIPTESGNLCLNGSLSSSDVAGKIVLCEQGTIARIAKGEVVLAAGGAGMIFLANSSTGDAVVADAHFLPATFVGYTSGLAIKAYAASSKSATAAIDFKGTVFGNIEGPAVASFSSRGPSSVNPEILKPDVIGPGVNILAAWPLDLSSTGLPEDKRLVKFNIISGTSMSCPHVSGLAALLKAAHPEWSPAAIKSALMTTAGVIDKKGLPILDSATNISADVFATGAGHVNPEKAASPGLVYDLSPADYIPYLCGLDYTASQIRVIVGTNVTCPTDPESTRPGNLNYPSFSALFDITVAPVTAAFKRTVTNVGAANSTYVASIETPLGVEVTVTPSVLFFKEVMEKQSYNIKFTVSTPAAHSFAQGSLTWVSNSTSLVYQVRSPISIVWYKP
ncbi:subtilisin-like protease 3 [Cryptomeria japonica]|uniref:subtilisin-like protease 3 n=1 Tax=Cryptomeria japonica TaxID=3369 RepID=UPI0025AD6BAD|nr:subtilisin-like protease 3 [Cryptomeria japonica]